MNDDMNKKLFKCPEGQEALAESFYDEIFHDGEYDRYGARVEPNNIVVDFGAYVGMFSQFAVSKGAKQVYCVEANPIHYECLVENTKHTPNIKNPFSPLPQPLRIERSIYL
jgi:16S rRNA G966 N2-methylase RsmD